MVSPLKIAVISDMHIGRGARGRDLCPVPKLGEAEILAFDDNYLDIFIDFLTKNNIVADYLFLAGDISDKANPSEFELANNVILRISTTLNVPANRIICVPGNHDSDWSVLKGKVSTGPLSSLRYDNFNCDKFIFNKSLEDNDGDICESPYYGIWDFDDILIVGFNSSWHDAPEVSMHYGEISYDTLNHLDDKLKKYDLNNNKIKVFLAHHHPIQYSNPAGNRDFSLMVNSEDLLDLLNKYKFDIFVHGHRHCPRFKTHSTDSCFPLAVLSSGSFSHKLEPRWNGFVNNQFHLFDICGRNVDGKTIYGTLNSWTYLCSHGWLPSNEHNGIMHKHYFGKYENPIILTAKLEPHITSKIATDGIFSWDDYVSHQELFRYLPHKLIKIVLEDISSRNHFNFYESKYDKLMITK